MWLPVLNNRPLCGNGHVHRVVTGLLHELHKQRVQKRNLDRLNVLFFLKKGYKDYPPVIIIQCQPKAYVSVMSSVEMQNSP